MNVRDRRILLSEMARLSKWVEAEATSDAIKTFLPLPSHGLALRTEIVVIRGGRGAGKSALFGVLSHLRDPERVKRFLHSLFTPRATWVDAFSQLETLHPEVSLLDRMACVLSDDSRLRVFWMTYLLRRILLEIPGILELPAELRFVLGDPLPDLPAWVGHAEQNLSTITTQLDGLERALQRTDQIIFAAYDHLDRIGAFNRETRRRYVSTLLALWLSLSNRYKRIRAKIFLRDDLFDEGELAFPDASKLRPRSVSLEWDRASIYRVAVRHLGAISPAMRHWLQGGRIPLLEDWGEDLGWMPIEMDDAAQKDFATRLAGQLMGTGVRKGYTWRWIPNRLQDAQVQIVPRSMIALLGHAAFAAERNPLEHGEQLLRPQDLQGALEPMSRSRVNEIREESPVVMRLENLRGVEVPLERKNLVKKLAGRVTGEPSGLPEAEIVFDELVRLGVLNIRADGRIDVPDLYRYGFDIKRKGGVKRPR